MPGEDVAGEGDKALAALREQLKAARHARGMTMQQLADLSQLSRTTVSGAFNDGVISEHTVRSLARTLQLRPEPLLDLLRQSRQRPDSPAAADGRLGRKRSVVAHPGIESMDGAVEVRCGPVVCYDLGADAIRAWLDAEGHAVLASLDAYERRGASSQDTVLNLDEIAGDPDDRARSLDEWAELARRGRAGEDLDEEEQRSLTSWLDTCARVTDVLVAASPWAARPVPDRRTPQEFRAQVATYLEDCNDALVDAWDRYFAALPPTRVHLVNRTPAHLSRVQVELTFPADTDAGHPDPDMAPIRWPQRPDPFGTAAARPARTGHAAPVPWGVHQPMDWSWTQDPHIEKNDAGHFVATYDDTDLRANKIVELPWLVIARSTDGPVTITWCATSPDRLGTAHGEITVTTTPATRSFARFALPQHDDHDLDISDRS